MVKLHLGCMKRAAHSITARCARLETISNVLIICGRHNAVFAGLLMRECCAAGVQPHLWVFDEKLLPKKDKAIVKDLDVRLPKHTRSLLENSDLVLWLTQYENPKTALEDLGMAVCSYWNRVYETVRGKPVLYISLLSATCIEAMGIEYATFLKAFSNAVDVDYGKVRLTGSRIVESLVRRESVEVTDPNGTDLSFSIKDRRVGMEVGTLEDCFSSGRECDVEVPGGEVYVAPVESSARGKLIVDEVRDFGVKRLEMNFEQGKVIDSRAESGMASFQRFLQKASGDKGRIAELGIGINHGMKPIGLRIFDEKALGTVHIAIGNNVHLGGTNDASIHIDFVLYKPTVKADDNIIIKEGQIVRQVQVSKRNP